MFENTEEMFHLVLQHRMFINAFTGLSWFISSTILKVITLEPFSTFLLITISKWIHGFGIFRPHDGCSHIISTIAFFIYSSANPGM
jgi:hypothetical protein